MKEKGEIRVSDAMPGEFEIAVVSIPIGCNMFQKKLIVNGYIRETKKNGKFVIDAFNQVICGGSATVSFNIAQVKDKQPGEFEKGIFEIYLKGGQKIIKIIENGIIRATNIGNVVFKNTESTFSVVCGQNARVLYLI